MTTSYARTTLLTNLLRSSTLFWSGDRHRWHHPVLHLTSYLSSSFLWAVSSLIFHGTNHDAITWSIHSRKFFSTISPSTLAFAHNGDPIETCAVTLGM